MSADHAPTNMKKFYLLLAVIAAVGTAVLVKMYLGNEPTVVDLSKIPVSDTTGGYSLGKLDAPVEIIEFADFECGHCSEFAILTGPDIRTRLIDSGRARFTFYDIQINSGFQNSPAASMAAACANEQGKFWEMHDSLFYHQDRWESKQTKDPKSVFQDFARGIGLNVDGWKKCFESNRYAARMKKHSDQAHNVGITGTPALIIDGKLYKGGLTYDEVKKVVDSLTALRPKSAIPLPGSGQPKSAIPLPGGGH
jgi:protein-disulfide isomerase